MSNYIILTNFIKKILHWTLSFALCLLIISCVTIEKEIDFNSLGVQSYSNKIKKGESLQNRMDYYKVPGVSIAIVKDNELIWDKGYGIANTNKGKKVTTKTLFQAASISKPITALSVLKLVEEKKVDLDENVNTYLKDWKVSENEFTKVEKVTLRRLLTHTAGITVHGFPGYKQNNRFPSITSVLNGFGNSGKIFVDTIPGTKWRYSGGGYTIIQKLVEDVSGMTFEEYMTKNILKPIGMENSTYSQPLSPNLTPFASCAYNSEGEMIDGQWNNYPELAAAGLWTTAKDLAKYCIEIQNITSGKHNSILTQETIKKMLTKHNNNWGLGPALGKDEESLIFGHGGKNEGYTSTFISSVYQGYALIILTNGDNGGKLIDEIQKSIFKFYKWEF